jgi:dihydroorotate dehydrogenase electron transfer subunit
MPVDLDARVIGNTRLSREYNVVALSAPVIAAAAAPGQFVMVKPSRGLDPLLRRPFSIFEILRAGKGAPVGISLLSKRVGIGTELIFDLEPGDHVGCLGPLGRPFAPVGPPSEAWMIAGGVGLAPFATLAEALSDRGARTTLFYGGRRADDLFYLHLFEALGARIVLTTEDGSRGEAGRVTVPLARALDERPPSQPVVLYACGPTPMMRAVADLAARHRRACQVSLEPVMGCGLGGCYSCVVQAREPGEAPHFVRSCLEGPVFSSDSIVWETLS